MPFPRLSLFLLALALAYLVALSFYPALAWDRRRRRAFYLLATLLIALTPLVIPAAAKLLRMLAAMNATALMVKLYDLHATCGPTLRPTFAAYVAYLPNWLCVVWRRLSATPQPTRTENARRLSLALVQAAAAIAALVWLGRGDWHAVPFLAEHAAKAFTFFLALVSISHAFTALWRLAGGRGLDPMDRPLLAATPGNFWRRYNRPAQQFFYDHIYRRLGGPPVRAILLTFAISAVIHEYVFGIVLGRVQGYQTVFFLVQGLAVAATARARPAGRRAWLATAATFLFNVVSSVFFFASVHGVVPFYSRGLPIWLRW